jgi:hypothetical protein
MGRSTRSCNRGARHARRSAALLTVFAALTLAACFNVGRHFPHGDIPAALHLGATTQRDVRERLGEPWRTGWEDGMRTWTYGHYRYSLFAPAHTRDLVLRFDADGVLRSYTYNSTEPDER